MDIELRMLAWAMVLGIAQMLAAAAAATAQRGLKWNASARDAEPGPLRPAAARLQRAWSNYLETFPFFAVAVLAVVLGQRQDAHTALAVQVYVWARLVYVPLYVLGIPYLRSLGWSVSMLAIATLLWALLG